MADAGVGSAAHSLGRAREALLKARADVEHSPSGANLKALADAQAHMDFLLDTLPTPPTPTGPGAHTPGPVVPFVAGGEHWPDDDQSYTDELLALGDGECTRTTQQDTDSEDV